MFGKKTYELSLVENGLIKTVYVGGGTYGTLRGYEPYRTRLEDSQVPVQTPFQFLTSWANANLQEQPLLMKHFEEQVLKAAHGWTVKV